MSIVVSSIVEVSMNKIALWIRVDVDDWTAERSITVSNVVQSIEFGSSVFLFFNFFSISVSAWVHRKRNCYLVILTINEFSINICYQRQVFCSRCFSCYIVLMAYISDSSFSLLLDFHVRSPCNIGYPWHLVVTILRPKHFFERDQLFIEILLCNV